MEEKPPEAHIGDLLRQRGLTLATAESCTGGLLGHRLTNVAGSSDYYRGGVIAYSNAAKTALLGVDPGTLAREGAVSEVVARQMARGVCRLFQAEVGIGITGIAGPGGGSAEKPVGLVYIAISSPWEERCERCLWPLDRLGNKVASSSRALQLLSEMLNQEP